MDPMEEVRIYIAGNAVEGEIVKRRLEIEGIPVLLKSEGDGPYRTGPAYLFVPPDYEARARAIVEATDAAGEEIQPVSPSDEAGPASTDNETPAPE